ncbi:MAG: hypothetical protein R2743_04020 [Ilumatobacteraceae bacterium]
MHRATLNDLQLRRCYPSVTLLLATTSGTPLSASQRDTAGRLIAEVDRRLAGDVDTATREAIVAELTALVADGADEPATHALAARTTTPPRPGRET